MKKLLKVFSTHLAAVERDLIVAGYHLYDIPRRLSWAELVSFVSAAPPISATWAAQPDRWSRTETLLATLIEAMTGNANVTGRFQRPGVSPEEIAAQQEARRRAEREHHAQKDGGRQFLKRPDVMTVSAFEAQYAEQQAKWKAAEQGGDAI